MVTLTHARSDPAQGTPETQPGHRFGNLSDHAHRQLIGYIGLLLPILLILLVLTRDGPATWTCLDSISAYYYTGAVTAFVGMEVALALFLFTYQGYPNEFYWADRAAAITAAVAALGVAFYPTEAPKCALPLIWWRSATGVIHFASAFTLFAMFAVFSLWLFRITPAGEQMSPGKRWRNRLYLVCGIVIVASIIWAAAARLAERSMFVPESVALVAFSISWLVKGYAHRTIANAARAMLRWWSAP